MMNHKKLLIGCGCALLAIALVVCLVLVIGNGAGDKPTLPSNGTTVTNPDGTTNPTDGTTPSGNTDPTGPGATTDPTTPSSPIVTEPTEPNPTAGLGEQETTPPPTDPSTGEDVIPTDPNDNENKDNNPNIDPDVNIDNVTPSTITADIWNNWDANQRERFFDSFDLDALTQDEYYTLYLAIQFNGYTCGFENHYCSSENDHNQMMAEMERGCRYCGQKDCASFYARNKKGFTATDTTKCPMYNVESDPTVYCQYCGHKLFGKCSSGETGCTRVISKDMPCPDCGEMIYVGKCHNCVHP